ncbi:MAG: hypothetical protein QOJ64_2371 [Acidobacteriota bacterium]|nr:hypothetical protein [Acidobacteriota bacterium]
MNSESEPTASEKPILAHIQYRTVRLREGRRARRMGSPAGGPPLNQERSRKSFLGKSIAGPLADAMRPGEARCRRGVSRGN